MHSYLLNYFKVNSQLMEAIQQKVELSQQLDQWQQDMQELLEEQMNRKMVGILSSDPTSTNFSLFLCRNSSRRVKAREVEQTATQARVRVNERGASSSPSLSFQGPLDPKRRRRRRRRRTKWWPARESSC